MSMRQVRRLSVAAALVVLLATAAVLWTSLELGARTPDPPQAVPTAAQLRLALYRVGLEPARLAAAGLSAAETSAVVDDVHGYLLGHPGPEVADAAAGSARAECLRKQPPEFLTIDRNEPERVALRAALFPGVRVTHTENAT